jgi:hypothetical protein
MSFWILVATEFVLCVLIIWGFAHEEKFIAFEQNVKRIVLGNYRRWKRLRGQKK